jgi:hypothetical protein
MEILVWQTVLVKGVMVVMFVSKSRENFPIYEHLFEYIGTQFTVWEDGFDYIVFFFQMGILDMIQHFMHEMLIGSSQYFTSYCIESRQ